MIWIKALFAVLFFVIILYIIFSLSLIKQQLKLILKHLYRKEESLSIINDEDIEKELLSHLESDLSDK